VANIKEIAFIDPAVPNTETLIEGLWSVEALARVIGAEVAAGAGDSTSGLPLFGQVRLLQPLLRLRGA
jgi:hypothetical protein